MEHTQLTLWATIGKVESLVDNSLKVSLYTSELPPKDAVDLFSMHSKQVYVVIGVNPIQEIPKDIIKAITAPKVEGKTQSQRLRNVLYRLRESEWVGGSFEDYYPMKMEQMIEHFKSKLPNDDH